MNITKLIMSLIVGIIIIQTTSAQLIKIGEDRLFAHGGFIYEYKELEPILQKNNVSYEIYKKAIRKEKMSKILGLVSLGSLVTGMSVFAVYSTIEVDNDSLYSPGALIVGGLVILTPIAGTMAISSGVAAKKSKRKSIDYFNQSQSIGLDESSELQWTVGVTQNGLGFTIRL